MIENPKVGQKCRLNDHGMRSIGGIMSRADYEASQNLTITGVSEVMTRHQGKAVYSLELSPFLIGRFLVSNFDVDPKE